MKKEIRKKLFNSFQEPNILFSLKKIFSIDQINFFLKETENLPKINLNTNLNIKKEGQDSKLIAMAMDSVNIHLNSKMDNSSMMIQSYTVSSNSKSMSQSQSKYNDNSIFKDIEKNLIPMSFTEKFKK